MAPVPRTSLVDISLTTPDPVMAARLANAHAEAYVSYGLDLRSQANQEATVFLQDKLLELKECALSTMVDGVVIVVDSQHTPKQLVRHARGRLKKTNAKILGVVLNRVDLSNDNRARR